MLVKVLVAFAIIVIAAGRVYVPLSRRERVREALEAECKKYGGEDHLDEVEQAVYQFADCVTENIDVLSIRQLDQTTDMMELRKGFLDITRSTCTKKSQLITCISNYMNASLPCIDPKERSKLPVAKKSMEDYMAYVCDNNAETISRLLDDGAIQCFVDKAQNLQICANRVQQLGNYQTLSVTQACNAFDELKTCAVDALRECPKQTTADFLGYTLESIRKGSRCDNRNTNTVNNIYNVNAVLLYR